MFRWLKHEQSLELSHKSVKTLEPYIGKLYKFSIPVFSVNFLLILKIISYFSLKLLFSTSGSHPPLVGSAKLISFQN